MDKYTLIYKISLYIGIPSFILKILENIALQQTIQDTKTIVLFIICALSGLIWLFRQALKLGEDWIQYKEKQITWKQKDHKWKEEERIFKKINKK